MLERIFWRSMHEVNLAGSDGCAGRLTGHADNQGKRELNPMRLGRLDPDECQGVVNNRELGGSAIADRLNIARKFLEAGTDARARTEGVPENVQSTRRNRLRHVKANGVISCDLFGKVPRL